MRALCSDDNNGWKVTDLTNSRLYIAFQLWFHYQNIIKVDSNWPSGSIPSLAITALREEGPEFAKLKKEKKEYQTDFCGTQGKQLKDTFCNYLLYFHHISKHSQVTLNLLTVVFSQFLLMQRETLHLPFIPYWETFLSFLFLEWFLIICFYNKFQLLDFYLVHLPTHNSIIFSCL